jgi:hypothetical protein
MRAPDGGMTAVEGKIFEFARQTLVELKTLDPRTKSARLFEDLALSAAMVIALYERGLEDPNASDSKEIEEDIVRICASGDNRYLRVLAGAFLVGEVPLPPPLLEWLIDNIGTTTPAPSGAPPDFYRNRDIARTIKAIIERWPIKATRNRARHGKGTPHSACSIMTAALRSLRENLEEGAVETVWRLRAKRLDHPPWPEALRRPVKRFHARGLHTTMVLMQKQCGSVLPTERPGRRRRRNERSVVR